MSIGPLQIVLIILVILLLFGAGRIPKLMKDLAEGIKAFKKGLNEEEKSSKIVHKVEKPKTLPKPGGNSKKSPPKKKPVSKKKPVKKAKK